MAVQQLTDGGSEGAYVGRSDDKLGFFGATPIVKPTSSAFANAGSSQDVLSATISTTGGIMTSQGASAVLDTINALVDAVHDLGLIDET